MSIRIAYCYKLSFNMLMKCLIIISADLYIIYYYKLLSSKRIN